MLKALFFVAGGLAIFTMSYPVGVYQKFSRGRQRYKLAFLFCFDAIQFEEKYSLNQNRSRDQIKMQSRFLIFVRVFHKFLSVTFGLFILKLAYENVQATKQFEVPSLFNLVVLIKVISYFAFLASFQSCLCTIFVPIYEVILSSHYLSHRLDALTEQVFHLFSSRRSLANQKSLARKISLITRNYNQVLRNQKEMDGHFFDSLVFPPVMLVYCLVYPALIIFEPRPDKKLPYIIFYVINYVIIELTLGVLTHYMTRFLNSNQRFVRSLRYLCKHTDLRSTIKMMNIHLLNQQTTFYSFNFRHFYNYTFEFLIYVSIL